VVGGIASHLAKAHDVGVEGRGVIGDLADIVDAGIAREANGGARRGHGGEIEVDGVLTLGHGTRAKGELAADGREDVIAIQPVKRRFLRVRVSPASRGIGSGAVLVEHVPRIAIAKDAGGRV